MKVTHVAGIVFVIVTMGVIGFQIALAAGAPWGAYAMGGAFPGQFPPAMRVSALAQAGILLVFAGVVLARAGLAFRRWARASRWLIWLVVAFSTLSLLLNLITPRAGERAIWAPVALVLLVCSLLVAVGKPDRDQR